MTRTIMNTSFRLSSALLALVASVSFVACDVVDDPTGSGSGAIQGSGAVCQQDSDCPSADEECDDNICKLHGGDGVEDGAGGDDAAGHDAGDDNGVDAAGHDAGDDNGVDAAGHDAGDDNGAGGEAGDDNGGKDGGADDNGADA
ncbi:MAG: hypothetical protein JNK04_06430 [Myxococcales bacterium]|nr:hypothetical protein [Myxococcales bacterium]